MNSKVTFKIELQYFLEDNKVIFHNEICNNGLATKSISIGNNKIIEKTINDRVLSGECLIDGTTCGYTYIYDQFGKTTGSKDGILSRNLINTKDISILLNCSDELALEILKNDAR